MPIKKRLISPLFFATFTLLLLPLSLHAIDNDSDDLAKLKALYERPKDIPFPKENPFSQARSELGKTLYFDPRLSSSGTQSCATCHNPGFSWGDGMGLGVGHGHQKLGRKSPTILNLAWDNEAEAYMWDGRESSLESQALGPIQAGVEMNMAIEKLIAALKNAKEYTPMFSAAFPDDPDPIKAENIAKAIATYERTVVSGEAPFDQWIQGNEDAIDDSAKRGFALFNKKANCASCHSGWRFSDASFHDIGISDADIGRGAKMPNVVTMQHAFKTVGLRNIDRRAPYMHNGSMATLMDVINHYDHGFTKRESLSDQIKELNLSEAEKEDLVSFLKTLTSNDEPVKIPPMPM